MAVVKPFRAIRYDEAVAGPLETLVAPPYDVISPEQREELRDRSPHNVVRLTLPDSEDEAARELERWRDEGALVEEPPAIWALEQEYVGPDGIERTRFGLVASLKVEPYETGTVLPHDRTHAGPKEGRLRLLRATRVQLEPIFLLYDGPAPLERPDRAPDVEVEGARLWRIDDSSVVRAFDNKQLLYFDGLVHLINSGEARIRGRDRSRRDGRVSEAERDPGRVSPRGPAFSGRGGPDGNRQRTVAAVRLRGLRVTWQAE